MVKILCVIESDKEVDVKMNGLTILGAFTNEEQIAKAKQKYIEFITYKPCLDSNLKEFNFDGSTFNFELRNCEIDVIDDSLWECTNFVCTNNKYWGTREENKSIPLWVDEAYIFNPGVK